MTTAKAKEVGSERASSPRCQTGSSSPLSLSVASLARTSRCLSLYSAAGWGRQQTRRSAGTLANQQALSAPFFVHRFSRPGQRSV